MKILIIVKSKHNENTLKIAEAMSEAAPVTVTSLENAENYKLRDYDIIGFGSGIYFGKHDKDLMRYAEKLNDSNSYVFVFSTSGTKNFDKNNSAFIKLLKSRNKTVLGSFGCLGLDKFFIFNLFGGLNKGKPDIEDFDAAQNFIIDVMRKYDTEKEK